MLERSTERFLPEDLDLYFDDIVDAAERVWDLLDNYKEVIEGLESTNEAFISHKQQYRLQLLTVVTVILLPLTLHHRPLRHERGAFRARARSRPFWVIVSVMVVLGLASARALPLPPLAVSARLVAPTAQAADGAVAGAVARLLDAGEPFWLDIADPSPEEDRRCCATPSASIRSRSRTPSTSASGRRPRTSRTSSSSSSTAGRPDEDGLVEVHCFYSERFLVTVRRDESPALDALRERLERDPDPASRRPRSSSTR